jgi:LmbE family N-acetylglucosaminyl deacetylase
MRLSRRPARAAAAPAGTVETADSLAAGLAEWRAGDERWLFVTPHDDDVVLGAGMLLSEAMNSGVASTVCVVTDGRMGYCRVEQRDEIVGIRRQETRAAMEALGGPELRMLGYPDCDLPRHAGRRIVSPDRGDEQPDPRGGHTGLQNSFTALLRELAPSRVFVPTGADYHPDHQIVHRELLISLFHATGLVWPELGEPIGQVPRLTEMAVYCHFPSSPTMELVGDPGHLEAKLRAIEAFASQEQIGTMVRTVREAGPVEYFREVPFTLYDPRHYTPSFSDAAAR